MKNTSVALYRMPNESDFYSLETEFPLVKNSKVETASFFFSDFDSEIIYSLQSPIISKNTWPDFAPHFQSEQNEITKSFYIKKIEEITQLIQNGEYKKVVFSKIKNIRKPRNFELKHTFESLCTKYPSAFVYCISSPEIGTWMGASPELLIQKNGRKFSTVSLAGTRVETVDWTTKEREEQQVVTDYISSKIAPFSHNILISEPYDLNTGSVIHLKSDIEGELSENSSIWEITKLLHPTPAVCGIPTKKAKKYIGENEGQNRKLYTGFIGPMNVNNHSSIFVNLRCMQVGSESLSLYLGGGIMGDSNPEKEWIETENKAKTLLSIIQSI